MEAAGFGYLNYFKQVFILINTIPKISEYLHPNNPFFTLPLAFQSICDCFLNHLQHWWSIIKKVKDKKKTEENYMKPKLNYT